jgi:hypothetical protein
MKSPLNISQGTIFILGATGFDSAYSLQDYRTAEDMTKSLKFEVVNPINILDGIDQSARYSDYDLMADWICYMAKCDKILTLSSYEQSPLANRILKIAQSMGKEVILADKFFQNIKA